jgi:hypothetical protein
MADFFKGLAGGLETGARFGQMLREGEERKRLREAMGLTPQEIAPRPPTQEELGRAQAYTQEIADKDEIMFAADSSVQNRTGLFSNNPAERPLDASVAPQMPYVGQSVGGTQYRLGDQTLSRMPTQQEIDTARYAAAANVIAERDPVAAMRMRQEQVRMQREAELAPLQKQQLEGSIAGQAQQRQLTGLQLKTAERTAAELQRGSDFAAFAAERPDATVAELKDAAFKQFKFTPKQWQDTVTTRLGIENAEMDSFKNNIKKKLQGKSLAQIGSIYNSDPDFDDKSDLAIVPGKGGAVTLNFIDKATNTITSSQSFKNEALATEYLNKQATEPETIGTWMMNLRKAESAIEAQGAATRASDATVGLRGAQMRQISNQEAASAEAQQIRAQFMALSDDDQAGPRGLALRQAFTMANAKAGAVVPLGAPPRAATGPARELSDLDKENLREYREWVKDPRNAKLPQGQKDAYAAQLGVTEFVNRAAAGPQAGIGSNPYATPQPGAALAASQPAQLSLGTAVPPRAGLVTPAQAAAAQTTQARQTAAQAQRATEEGIRTQGVARRNYELQQEAASLTPAVIRQLTPAQAAEASRLYGQFLTPEQRREVNRRQ